MHIDRIAKAGATLVLNQLIEDLTEVVNKIEPKNGSDPLAAGFNAGYEKALLDIIERLNDVKSACGNAHAG